MMKRFTLVAASVIAVAVLAGLLWFISRTTATPRPEGSGVAQPVAPSDSPAHAVSDATANALDADPSRDVDAPASQDVAGRSAAPESDAARNLRVRGRVRTKIPACEDPTLEVLACSASASRETVASWIANESEDGARKTKILARAPIAADGTFEIALHDGTQRAHFTVAGRYLYRGESIELDVSGTAPSVEIDADVGAWISGELDFPVDSPVPMSELEGATVRLRTSIEGAVGAAADVVRLSREAKCAAGRFEFRGVPTTTGYRASIDPKHLAACEVKVTDLAPCQTRALHLPLLRGGTIRGIVRGPDHAGVSGAKVEASVSGTWFGFDNRGVRDTISAADGTFELLAVTPGKIVLTAERDGLLDSEKVTIELADDGVQSGVEIVLSAGKSVAGTVTFADGTPASGASVKLGFDMSKMYGMGAFNALRGSKGETVAHADGRFEITGLGDGPFTVNASGLPAGVEIANAKDREKELHKARVDNVTPGTTDVALVLRAPEGVAGRVVDETGAPVAKFRLHAVRPSEGLMGNFGQESHEESFTSDDGHFLLTGLETGKWELFAIAEGFAHPDPFALSLPREATEDAIVIALVHGATVRGHVRGSTGALVGGASIDIDTGAPNWKANLVQGPKQPSAKSLPDGTFTLTNLHPGHVKLVADAAEHAKSLPVELELAAAAEVNDVEFVLRTGGTLTGEVFDDAGEPAVGLLVQITDPKNFEQQTRFSDGHGQFKVEHLEPSSWQVVALPTSMFQKPAASDGAASDTDQAMSMFSKMKMAMVDVKDGEETHVVLGALPKDPVKVFGRVTHHGEPFASALVIFYREGKGVLSGMKSAQVDKDGNYSMVLDAAGPYLASVQKFAGSMNQQSVVEFSCDIPLEKEYRLDFAMPTARISGRVRDAEGEPAKSARVSLHPETAVEAGTMWGGQYNELATDSEGRFDIQALRPGKYSLIIGGMTLGGMFGDDAALGREVRGGLALSEGEWLRDVDFRLKRPGTLEVTVVDTTGAPIAEAAVFARNERGELVDRFSMVSTDAKGVAMYGGLAPGHYTLSARKGALAAADSPRFTVEAGVKTPAKVELAGGTTLIVSLVGAPDKPLKASVSVTDDDGRELSTMLGLSELMKLFSEGGLSMTERRFGPLPPGRYKIQGRADGKTVTKSLTLTGQAERKLTLRFND